jgi:hypothetical protein
MIWFRLKKHHFSLRGEQLWETPREAGSPGERIIQSSKNEWLTYYDMDESQEHNPKKKRQNPKAHLLYNSI